MLGGVNMEVDWRGPVPAQADHHPALLEWIPRVKEVLSDEFAFVQ
jgi:hypothetical protein